MYELTKKSQGGLFGEIKVFGQEKGHIRVIYVTYKISDRQKTDKIESMTKKKVIRNLGG